MVEDSSGVVFDIKRFDLNSNPELKAKLTAPAQLTLRQHQKTWFLRGPIPGPWISAACGLGLNALRVGLAVWHVARLDKSHSVTLSAANMKRFAIARIDPGLTDLEQAGLVEVTRQRGKRPSITIREVA